MPVDPLGFKITVDLGNKLTAYLGTRPYQEVSGLIVELQRAFQDAELPKGTGISAATPPKPTDEGEHDDE